MNVDPWISIIKQVCPEYDESLNSMIKGPTIIPTLERSTDRRWKIILVEHWDVDEELFKGTISSSGLDEKVEWCTDILKSWASAKRMAFDQWYFDDKREAEKFITFYHLYWG